MRITTKRIKVIEMTAEEIEKFHCLMEQAREGHTSHYAEERLDDGSFLGVAVVDKAPPMNAPRHVKSSRRDFADDSN